jgi:hypothetical protein
MVISVTRGIRQGALSRLPVGGSVPPRALRELMIAARDLGVGAWSEGPLTIRHLPTINPFFFLIAASDRAIASWVRFALMTRQDPRDPGGESTFLLGGTAQ